MKAGTVSRVVQDADDAGGALVLRPGEPQAAGLLGGRRRAHDGHGSAVRHVGQEGAQRDERLGADLLRSVDDGGRERSPPHVGLDRGEEDDLSALRGGPRELAAGPLDDPADSVLQPDGRPRDLEVDELLGVQGSHPRALPALDQIADGDGSRFAPVVPAPDGRDHRGVAEVGMQLELDVGVAHPSRLQQPS